MVERAAHNGFVVGSNPARPIKHIKIHSMKFDLKDFQIFKLKKYFKNHKFFFIFHAAKSQAKDWKKTEQNLKKLKLTYYKTLNGTSIKTLNNSIYKNYTGLVNSMEVFVKPVFNSTSFEYNTIKKSLNNNFLLIAIKLNNNIYSTSQLKNIKALSFETLLTSLFHRSLIFLKSIST